jgi:hypothetical protein
MRLMSVSVTFFLSLLSTTALAQQPPGLSPNTQNAPPLVAAPPVAEKPAATSAPEAAKGYIGAYGPPGPSKPYWTGPLPEADTGPGRTVVEPDGSVKTTKAVPCSTFARETDGTTTCIGLPEESKAKKRR